MTSERAAARPPAPGMRASWSGQSTTLRLLRVFLGVTFLYAGVQKFADASYLRPGAPGFIGTQLRGFAHGAPLGWLLHIAGHAPVATGVAVAAAEIAIGVATLAGVASIAAAAAGCALSAVLFLTATWHVRPYFLGSDSIYAVAWLAYLAGTVEIRRNVRLAWQQRGRKVRSAAAADAGRRRFLRGAVLAAGTVVLGAMAGALAGKPQTLLRTPRALAETETGEGAGGSEAGETGESAGAAPTQPPAAPGEAIGSLSSIPVGGAVGFTDPGRGDPAVLVRLSKDRVAAYSRVCTHSGCLVDYDSGSRLLFCPCHGAEFDPSSGARPITGPAYNPLPNIPVRLDPGTGRITLA